MDKFMEWLKQNKINGYARPHVIQANGDVWVKIYFPSDNVLADQDYVESKAAEYGLRSAAMRNGLLVGKNPFAW